MRTFCSLLVLSLAAGALAHAGVLTAITSRSGLTDSATWVAYSQGFHNAPVTITSSNNVPITAYDMTFQFRFDQGGYYGDFNPNDYVAETGIDRDGSPIYLLFGDDISALAFEVDQEGGNPFTVVLTVFGNSGHLGALGNSAQLGQFSFNEPGNVGMTPATVGILDTAAEINEVDIAIHNQAVWIDQLSLSESSAPEAASFAEAAIGALVLGAVGLRRRRKLQFQAQFSTALFNSR